MDPLNQLTIYEEAALPASQTALLPVNYQNNVLFLSLF
jgi:hypothetical protein